MARKGPVVWLKIRLLLGVMDVKPAGLIVTVGED